MNRPTLHAIPFPDPFPPRGALIVTMSRGQWDTILKVAYEEGAILLELDEQEQPVACYQKEILI